MLRYPVIALVAAGLTVGAAAAWNTGRAWYQKYQAQQDWLAAHGGKHEDHK